MPVSQNKIAIALGILGAAITIFGAVLVFVGPDTINQQIVKNVQIDPKNKMTFTMWKDIPVPFFFSIYIFDVKNPDEILRGEKPVVNQRGPYVYREYRQKDNITFHDNGTVSYQEYRHFHFWRNMSVGSEDDILTVPNMLVLGASIMMENIPYVMKLAISAGFKMFKEEAFVTRKVGELIWGYEDPLVDFINSYFPDMIPFKGKFGLFATFNNSNTGLFTVFTGVDDISRVHMVDSWNGLKTVNYWRSKQCNMINGTSGQMWPPFMTPSTTLRFYSPDACRSMELVYQESGSFQGIPTFRYVAPKTLFANGTDYPPNEGFCPCRQSGIQNVSACRFNSPVFISHPHFYNGDPTLAQAVDGLHPNEKDHALFIDVHPVTGIPMNCSIKLQLNLFIKAVRGFIETGKISPVVLPVLWFGEIGYIDGQVLSTFRTNMVVLPAILEYLQYIFIALGCLFIIIAAILVIRNKKPAQEEKHPKMFEQNEESSPIEGTPLLKESSLEINYAQNVDA
nr:PREDICTED: scavenger receptor class B member 1 isoform X2 [Latimeria chalumnae]|eukprot:XP_014339656.1 PREDICTED: scavenger receptor class B member 1 isoform X2 [Latimeria chalumnae]